VNENYDEGAIIAQQRCINSSDTFATVAERIHELEQAFSQLL
jgi:folate-dependent phosphoribosylglycinamide formyltransferase PurN